jgi:hypothetical protein
MTAATLPAFKLGKLRSDLMESASLCISHMSRYRYIADGREDVSVKQQDWQFQIFERQIDSLPYLPILERWFLTPRGDWIYSRNSRNIGDLGMNCLSRNSPRDLCCPEVGPISGFDS